MNGASQLGTRLERRSGGVHGDDALVRPTGRFEKRIVRTVRVEISSLDDPLLKEMAHTENISSRGARVITHREWTPRSLVLVISPKDNVRSCAQIVYSQSLGEGRFAVGLELAVRSEQWTSPG